jgi:hypothetical protein
VEEVAVCQPTSTKPHERSARSQQRLPATDSSPPRQGKSKHDDDDDDDDDDDGAADDDEEEEDDDASKVTGDRHG